MYCQVKCVLFSYSCIWYANWCGLIPLQVLLCKETGVKKCNPCGFRLEKLHQFSIPWNQWLSFSENLYCVQTSDSIYSYSNYFWLKLNCLISLWYSAVPNTISPFRQKYLEHDVWITPRNIIYLASYGIFLTAIFLIPFIYLVKELFAFLFVLSQQ